MRKTASTIVTLSLLALASCSSSKELTRSQANKLLSQNKLFTTKYNTLHWLTNGYEEYIAQGGANNQLFAKHLVSADTDKALLNTSLGIRVDDITGIALSAVGQDMKDVLFRWSMTEVPDVLTPLVVISGTGKATMRLYDDGWRVEEGGPSITLDTTPPQLTATQKSRVESFKQAELTRRAQQVEQARLAEQRRQERFEASMTPTKTTYRTGIIDGNAELIVTDVNVTIAYPHKPPYTESTWEPYTVVRLSEWCVNK